MNAAQTQGTLDVIGWKRDLVQRHISRILLVGLELRARGIDRYTADDVPSEDLSERDRNVIGSTFSMIANMKHPLIEPVLVATDEGLRPLTRLSRKQQGHGNPLRVWRVRLPEAVLWLRKHGYETPDKEPQLKLV